MTFIFGFQKSGITQKYWIFEIKQDHFRTSFSDIYCPTYQEYSDEPQVQPRDESTVGIT